MKFNLLSLFYLLALPSLGQVTVVEAPEEYQLFPRNANNTARVPFIFTSTSAGTAKFQVLENGKLIHESTRSFLAQDTLDFTRTIEAKASEYSFILQVGTQTIERKHIVCGDFLVLYGQSNIKALSGIDYFQVDTRLLRNYDTKHPTEPNRWSTADLPYGSVGIIGLQLQSLILEKYGIPTCVINASRGGANLYSLLEHGEYYQTLMQRIKGAGATGHIKAILWRQGEAETCNWYKDIEDYPMHFTQLMRQIDRDFPELIKFYNIQTGILHCNQMEDAGKLREYMRRTRYLFPKVETTNMHQLPLSDDVHYSKEAYIQTANELLPLLGRDLYQDHDHPEIHPPDIQQIYRSPSGDTLVLEFEKGQSMHFPPPHTKNGFDWKMEDYFFVNTVTQAQHNLVQKGWASENKVYLKLNWQIKEGFVSYLPSYAKSSPPVQDIHLKNSRGLRAMSFYQFPIKTLLPTPQIKEITLFSKEQVKIHFLEKGHYVLERKKDQDPEYSLLAKLENADHHLDQADFTQKVGYRLRRINQESVSEYSAVHSYDFRAEVHSVHPSRILQNHSEPLRLEGQNFGLEQGKVSVLNRALPVLSWGNENITFSWPGNMPSGEVVISVETAFKQVLNTKIRVDALLHSTPEHAAVLFPQPLTDRQYAHLKTKAAVHSVVAVDALGNETKLVIKEKLPEAYLIDTGTLPAGMYILVLTGTQYRETLRFQKL